MATNRKFKTTWFWSKLAENKGKSKPRHVDFDEYSEGIEKAYNELDSEGYEVVNVIPMQMGKTEIAGAGFAGFGITRGAVLVGKLKDAE